jgi:uncharacterized protein YfaS (alpha-2-macroglobulin family)
LWFSSAIALAAGVAAAVLLTVSAETGRSEPPLPTPAAATAGGAGAAGAGQMTAPPTWQEIERLISEQKYEAAVQAVAAVRAAAQAAGDEADWTRALVKETQLRIGLHGYETAVRFLKDSPWPKGALPHATLDLFCAQALVIYADAYSWEIGRRERVETTEVVDLKAWTREQIIAAAEGAFLDSWRGREAFGREPVTRLAGFIEANTYPPEVRGTLRDALAYLFVALLADSSHWSPAQANEVFALDLPALIKGNAGTNAAALTDANAHPLVKLAAVLDDLEAWHAGSGQPAAALEARLERVRRLHQAFDRSDDRAAIRADLETRLPAFRDVEWWAMGVAQLAEFERTDGAADALVRARATAAQGLAAYPHSPGGARCRSIIAAIEAPAYEVSAMRSDAPAKRSLEVRHKNLAALYLRAYPADLVRRIESARDYNLLPRADEIRTLVRDGHASATWRAPLPATPDYRLHRTFVTPPPLPRGFYIVVASARSDFRDDDNRLRALPMLVSDLVLLTRQDEDSGLTVRALSGASGAPLAGTEVWLYRYDWQHGHTRVATLTSDGNGEVRFASTPDRTSSSHFVLARSGDDLALDSSYVSFWQRPEPGESTAALVYTDRSVYRPLQKLYWKVVAYRGRGDRGQFRTLPDMPATVKLLDANREVVASATVTTNGFGSAAGEFALPAGRMLGGWRIECSLGGGQTVRVEEYKRPTFEATFKDPAEPLRLNRSALLTGEVRYYFGLPVVNGSVRWRVTREPVLPWWWGWWYPTQTQSQTVATGSAQLDENGAFAVRFTPRADERLAARGSAISYRYLVAADVTDEGGETRSATRTFRLGFVAVEARVDAATAFFRTDTPAAVTVVRSNLDGSPRPGTGTWSLAALRQPDHAPLPADEPLPPPASGATDAEDESVAPASRTPGDTLRPRWQTDVNPRATLRGWHDGAERARGVVTHDGKGEARIALGTLAAGAYRLHYRTVDEFGTPYETSTEFVVADAHSTLALPALLLAESSSVAVGGTARVLVLSGLAFQPLTLDIARAGRALETRRLQSGRDATLIEFPVEASDRGGFSVTLTAVRDHQLMQLSQTVLVPWDDRTLTLSFASFRDTLRPGARETWRVTVKDAGGNAAGGAAELLAYMYDRSLDLFAAHTPPDPLALYPQRSAAALYRTTLGAAAGQWFTGGDFAAVALPPPLRDDRLTFLDGNGIGGPGRRGMVMKAALPAAAMREEAGVQRVVGGVAADAASAPQEAKGAPLVTAAPAAAGSEPALRSDFAETAFWRPQLLTGADGSAGIEFTVPDSVTAWNVWVHALTRDLKAGSLHASARSVKELMVRPYLPRFLREGDAAEIRVVVNNASDHELRGQVALDILDPDGNASLLSQFQVDKQAAARPFAVKAGAGTSVAFRVAAPVGARTVAFRVTGSADDLSDGELRPLPVLPARVHLAQSRFVTLRNADRRVLRFDDLAQSNDPTRSNERMVVTVDAQLFYTVLQALPYLVNYPYECTEQTLNRFLSTGIVSTLYADYPAVARMAKEFSAPTTRLETFAAADPNRGMALEETPWLVEARGGDTGQPLANVLDARIARAERDAALAKLRKAQTALGGFPWWPGGPPSPYMTLYLMHGFAKAAEFGVDVPRDMVQRGWTYLARHFRDDERVLMGKDCDWEFLTFLNYVASCYPDPSWTGSALTEAERREILAFSFKHWRQHTPYLKGYLALTLRRMGRPADAKLVWDSVMDAAKTTPDGGTFWAPEDRAWLWYNDTIESHAFALRTLMELAPADPRRDGLVQWLLLNKKLNQWKSTRATAEVIYALVHYLKAEGAVGIPEDATVSVGNERVSFSFDPERYTGKRNQVVVPGEKLGPESAAVIVEKQSKGLVFASATWQFSTEKLPEQERGDLFAISRRYFRRESTAQGFVLKPLADGATLAVGDEVEVQLSLRAGHAAEYVHVRDPRGAGFEPVSTTSRFRWELGTGWYEEVRDSGTNFFFEQLPAGEYPLRYRLRATTAGTFRVGPATVQSMYAPEFSAYSTGAALTIGPAR